MTTKTVTLTLDECEVRRIVAALRRCISQDRELARLGTATVLNTDQARLAEKLKWKVEEQSGLYEEG